MIFPVSNSRELVQKPYLSVKIKISVEISNYWCH